MENQLKQRILIERFSNVSLAESICYRTESETSRDRTKQLKSLKTVIVLVMAVVFIVYRICFESSRTRCLTDLTHELTSKLNQLVNDSSLFYNVLSIISQEAIEIEIILLTAIAIMRMRNLKIHMFAAAFYGVRALHLNIQKLPYPQGIVSYDPVFPCFTVPYGITRDFFYSGHTGLMLFSALFWGRLKYRKMEGASYVLMSVVVAALLVTRVHYIIDIVGGAIFTLWFEKYLLAQVKYFDYIFTCFYRGGVSFYRLVRQHLN